MQLSVMPHLTIYGDVKPEQLKKPLATQMYNKVLELSPFRSATTKEISTVTKMTAQEAMLMNISNSLMLQ